MLAHYDEEEEDEDYVKKKGDFIRIEEGEKERVINSVREKLTARKGKQENLEVSKNVGSDYLSITQT